MLGSTFEKLVPARLRERYRNHELEQLRERNAELTSGLQEREVLLQEVHHRVKNNLQIIASLISMQARKLDDGAPRDILLESKTRVDAIALIHEKLHHSHDFEAVPFSDYIRSLSDNVLCASGARSVGVSIDVDTEAISLDVHKAVPCGLILNELLTNAMKHAFPERAGGIIRVALKRAGEDRVQLTVSDNGVGLPACNGDAHHSSMGLHLVATLAEQLDGTMEVLSHAGTSVRVVFPCSD